MIERYSRPEMTRLWTDEYRFEKMLEVELLNTSQYAEIFERGGAADHEGI